jgi:exodeoxyribonuclease VII large subunit
MQNSVFSVSTLTNVYPNNLSSDMGGKLIVLKGFYSDKKGKLYDGHYYDEIINKDKNHAITIQIAESLKSKLSSGKYYEFEGFVNKRRVLENDSKLKVLFRVAKILKYEERIQLISQEEKNIIRSRIYRDFPFIQGRLVDKLQVNSKPVIDVIIEVNSTSRDEFESQLIDSEYYDIKYHQCNLSSSIAILNFLCKHNFSDTNLLVVLSSCGSSLEVFNDVGLCERFIELPIPFIVGIGNSENKTLLQRIADRRFSTPTSIGVFLQSIVYEFRREIENKKNEIQIQEDIEVASKILTLITCLILVVFLIGIISFWIN